MQRYLLRRTLQAIPILFGVSIIVFLVTRLAPGNPFQYLLDPELDPDSFKRLAEEFGLNKPLYVQYWMWLKETLSGNLGFSIRYQRPVVDMMAERLGPTLLLTGSAYVLAVMVAVPVGVIAATRQYSVFDHSVSTFAYLGISLPSFFAALLAIYFFGVTLEWVPTSGMQTPGEPFSILDRLHHLVLPMLTLAVRDLAGLTRFTRSSLLEVLRQDYVRTARSKGLAERVVLFKHSLRNGLLPLITLFGLNLPDLFSGVLILETVFTWPGMGLMAAQGVLNRDYPVLMTLNLFFALVVILGNLLADILYAAADPRIRYT